MYCQKCGMSNSENSSFCANCGNPLTSVQQNFASNPQNVSQMNLNQNNNEDLIDAYIGKNADKLKSKKFSLPTLFLGVLYVFYRKMWGLGLLWMLISIVSVIIPFGPFILPIVVAIIFNKTYLKNVTKKVEKIISENPGKTREELKLICSKKGGTSMIPVVLFSLIVLAIVGFYVWIVLYSISANGGFDKTSDAKAEASVIILKVNGYCFDAKMDYLINGEYNPCADGVSTSEVATIVDLGKTTVLDIEYNNDNVEYLKIKYKGITVEYEDGNYSVID